jgi:hypothetical protein
LPEPADPQAPIMVFMNWQAGLNRYFAQVVETIVSDVRLISE